MRHSWPIRQRYRGNSQKWRATADEDGHLYEASPVKGRFARASLSCLPKRACVCIHGMVVPLLGRAFAVKPQRPQGLRLWAQGLDGERTRRAIMVWAVPGARGFQQSAFLSSVVFFHLIQGGALIEVCGTRRINLYPVGIPVPRSLMHRCEGKGAPRRMGPIY
jgi:hypothetical protein